MKFGWLKYLEPLAKPVAERLAKWIAGKSGEDTKHDDEAARHGTAIGEGYRRASREAGPKKDDK